jgi:tRNA A37 methylthiotransferase MiaB
MNLTNYSDIFVNPFSAEEIEVIINHVNLTGMNSRASKIFTIVPKSHKLPHVPSSKTVRFINALSGCNVRLEYCPLSY